MPSTTGDKKGDKRRPTGSEDLSNVENKHNKTRKSKNLSKYLQRVRPLTNTPVTSSRTSTSKGAEEKNKKRIPAAVSSIIASTAAAKQHANLAQSSDKKSSRGLLNFKPLNQTRTKNRSLENPTKLERLLKSNSKLKSIRPPEDSILYPKQQFTTTAPANLPGEPSKLEKTFVTVSASTCRSQKENNDEPLTKPSLQNGVDHNLSDHIKQTPSGKSNTAAYGKESLYQTQKALLSCPFKTGRLLNVLRNQYSLGSDIHQHAVDLLKPGNITYPRLHVLPGKIEVHHLRKAAQVLGAEVEKIHKASQKTRRIRKKLRSMLNMK